MAPRDLGNPASPLEPKSKDELAKFLPDIGRLGIDWSLENLQDSTGSIVEPLDSSDVNSEHWTHMALHIGRNYQDYDGFVVLHGTDTMAFTSSGLSFMFENLAKPIVVTGSQLPISDMRTDAVMNFMNAVYVAGYRATGLPRIPEVVLSFADVLIRGCRASKVSTTAWRGFDSPNFKVLGDIGEHIVIDTSLLRPVPDEENAPFFVKSELETNVFSIPIFPGLRSDQLDAVLKLEGLRGVVIETFGAGNAPSSSDFLQPIADAVERGVVILNVTQCVQGKVEAGLYEAGSGLLDRGVLSGIDMTKEAALAKLMSLIKNIAPSDLPSQMQTNQVGEMSESLFDLRYGGASGEAVLSLSASPSGSYVRRLLNTAVVRVRGLRVPGVDATEVRVFVNNPSATSATPVDDPRLACTLQAGDKPSSSSSDITTTIRKVSQDGQPIQLTLVPVTGDSVEVANLGLSLAASA
jgi:L-asparaginase